MSFYDDASLIFDAGAAAGKDGKAYNLKPTDGSGDFTFTRGANLTATRVGKDGYIEKGREQLLYNTVWSGVSEDTAPTGWTGAITASGTFNATSTPGQIRFTCGALDRSYIQGQAFTTDGPLALSVYVDEVHTACRVGSVIGYGGVTAVKIDYYEDGVAIDVADNVQAGKRYSYVINRTDSDNGYPRIGVGIDNVREGDITLSRPQFEIGLAATAYIENTSTTATATAGVLEDEPRFDYTGGGCPALLMEPTRTNYFEQSEYIASSYWFKENVTITQNDATSPEGVYNAVKLIDNSTEARHRISQATSFTSGTDYTLSVFVKKNSSGRFLLLNANTAFNARAALNLDTLEVTNINGTKGKVEDYGNGWYRFSVSGQATSTTSTSTYIQMQDSASDVNYVGDGSSFYLYGVQVEAGAYPTSYIPTYGSSATRDGDGTAFSSPSMLTGGYDLSSSWSLFVDANSLKKSGASSVRFLGLHTSGDYNVQFYVNGSASTPGVNAYLQNNVGYVFGFNSNDAGSEDGFKVCLTYDAGTNKISYYINGSLYNSTTSALTFGDETYGYIVGPSNLPTTPTTDVSVGFKQVLFAPTAFSGNDSEILTGAPSYRSFNVMRSALNYTAYE